MTPLAIILQAQLSLHIARASWWQAHAHTPANLARTVYKGGSDGELLGRDELIDRAMSIADSHLHNAQKTLEALNEELSPSP